MTFPDLIYKAWAHLWNNKQTYLAYVIAALGYVQGSDQLRNALSPDAYGWLMFWGGLLMVVFARSNAGGVVSGIVPAHISTVPPSQRVPVVLMAGCAGLLALMLVGCPGTQAAFRAAETPDEFAYVLAEQYAVSVEQAGEIRQRGTASASAIAALQRADKAAFPVIERLRDARDAYLDVKNAETEAELQAAVNEAVKLVADLIRAVKAAQANGAVSQLEHRILYQAARLQEAA